MRGHVDESDGKKVSYGQEGESEAQTLDPIQEDQSGGGGGPTPAVQAGFVQSFLRGLLRNTEGGGLREEPKGDEFESRGGAHITPCGCPHCATPFSSPIHPPLMW